MAMVTTKKQYEFCNDLWGVIMSYLGQVEYTEYGCFNGNVIIDINYLRTEGEYGIFKNSYKMINRITSEVTYHKYHLNRKEDALIKYKLDTLKRSYSVYPNAERPYGGNLIKYEEEEVTFSPMFKYTKLNKELKEKVRIKIVEKRHKKNTKTKLIEDDLYINGEKWSPRTHIITNYKKLEQVRQCINIKTGEYRKDTRVIKPSYRIITHIDYKSNKYKEGTRIIDL